MMMPQPWAVVFVLAGSAGGFGMPGRGSVREVVRSAAYDLSSVERSLATERDACGTGFVAEARLEEPSRRVVELALAACACVEHRGACGSDEVSGDGAGVLTSIPWNVYEADTPKLAEFRASSRDVEVGCAMLFLPTDDRMASLARSVVEECARGAGFDIVAWRRAPVNAEVLGATSRASAPLIEQVFLAQAGAAASARPWAGKALERALYLLRRSIRGAWIRAGGSRENEDSCYVVSCSSRTVVYKAMCRSADLRQFYLDLDDERFVSRFCIYHRRFSTNTLPRWSLAQPFRMLAHNGEINNIRGSVNWMAARAKAAGDDLGVIAAGCRSRDGETADEACAFVDHQGLGPVVDASKSDSANLDATCELYARAGASVAEALLLMIPPARNAVDDDEAVFFDLHAPLQEAWDGPAGVCFSDGSLVGARLDRNGLRPARYTSYDDGLVCLSSETGATTLLQHELPADDPAWLPADARIVARGRLGPGEMLVVDLQKGGLFDDAAVRKRLAAKPKWAQALKRQRRSRLDPSLDFFLPDDDDDDEVPSPESRARLQTAFGWGAEDVELQVKSMMTGKEPTLCMGADAPLAVLSKYAHPLFNYLKQRHAQVTNPPMDPIREGHVMSLRMFLGERQNCVDAITHVDDDDDDDVSPDASSSSSSSSSSLTRVVEIESPVVNGPELARLVEELDGGVWIDATYGAEVETLERAVAALVDRAVGAVRDDGSKLVVISDRRMEEELTTRTYVPPLVAVGAVHHALIDAGLRLKASVVVETGQCWSTHHLACLVGYGASAVHPYLLFEEARAMTLKKKKQSVVEALGKTREALNAGLKKVLSKMGISEATSYHGAQVFEAIGVGADVVEVALRGTSSRVGGATLADLQAETAAFVEAARSGSSSTVFKLENYGFATALGGDRGEVHANSPKVARLLHAAVREDDPEERRCKYEAFVAALGQTAPLGLRDLLGFVHVSPNDTRRRIPAADASAAILRRFVTGGMSLGALSREAHETLAIAMNRLGGASNSGEGGEDAARNAPITSENREAAWGHLRGESVRDGDSAKSKIRQVASGRFGVTAEYLAGASQIEIKIAQGAKPGEGGQLPGNKVDEYISSIRLTTKGATLISPPPHHDIYSIEDLAQLVFDLKAVAPHARVSVKLVSIVGVGTVACGVAKAGADVVQISGHDGGTGAAPLTSIKNSGAPLELGLVEAHTQLVENGLRDRVTLRVDGGVRTGSDVVKLALLGAEEFGFGTAAMIASGCVMARVCHTNKCPVGVATQNPDLRERFRGEPRDVVRYLELVADETRRILEDVLGLDSLAAAVGRVDLLEAVKIDEPVEDALSKASRVDVDAFVLASKRTTAGRFAAPETPLPPRPLLTSRPGGAHADDPILSFLGICDDDDSSSALAVVVDHSDATARHATNDEDRAVGARLAGALARRASDDDRVHLKYRGSAGQSFGAFATQAMTLELEGDANDYVGKGLSGGTLVVRPHREAEANGIFVAADSVIVGNTCLYGATRGRLYAAGGAGDRFAVRNSGAIAVVEASGDHLCEYMTGGIIVSLGPTGINVGAGMTGGTAYLYSEGDLARRLNSDVLARRIPDPASPAAETIKTLLDAHWEATASRRAAALLESWDSTLHHFWQVIAPADIDLPQNAVTSVQYLPTTSSSSSSSSSPPNPVSAR